MPPEPESPQVVMLPEVDRTDEIYARAIELAYGPSRRQARLQLVLNALYYTSLVALVGWIFSMAIDREPPVRQITREVVNTGKQVHVGDRLLIRGVRVRDRSCEITRRWWIVDGAGRRLDFEPERFDAYGPLGREEEVIGPFIRSTRCPAEAGFSEWWPTTAIRSSGRSDGRYHDPSAAGIRDPAADARFMTCAPVEQDLTVVIALLALMAGIIIGNRTAPKDPPAGSD